MAFPQVAATSTGNFSTTGSGAITLPTGISAGDRLLVFISSDNGNGDTLTYTPTGTGWSVIATENTVAHSSAWLEKLSASGDSADDLSVALGGNSAAELLAYIGLRITGHDAAEAVAQAVQSFFDVGAGDPSANPDAPSLSPSWGSADTLWLWGAAWDNATRTISSYPSSYTSNQVANNAASSSAGVALAIASRELASSSTDPGTATISVAEQWSAWLIGVKPAGGGDTTAPTLTSPDFTATGETTGTATVSTDEGNGTLFCVITTSATSPSVAQVKAGNDHTGTAAAFAAGSGSGQAVSATGTQTVNVTGLADSTAYYAHFVHTDAAANDSTVSTDATGDTTDTPDTTAPVLSSPVGTTTGATTATVGATTDEGNGTLYVVVTTSATAPSASQIKAGQDHTGAAAVFDDSQAVSSTGAKTFSATGLTASTAYRAHLVHTDAAANDSNIVTSAEFTTDAAVSNNIRITIGAYWERGGEYASQTINRWQVFSVDGATMHHTGTGTSFDASGIEVIDINASAFDVGDEGRFILWMQDSATLNADKTVTLVGGYFTAAAQT
jgi:hypothetical protein